MSTLPSMADLYPGLPTDATVTTPVPHQVLLDLAVRFTHLVVTARDTGMSAADVAGRAESALREAATGDVFSTAVSLGVESMNPGARGALSAEGQAEVVELAKMLGDPEVYGQWADLLGRDALYIVAITMAARRATRAKNADKPANTKTTDKPTTLTGGLFE